MKKIFALFLCVFYFLSTNACFAFEELYYMKNVSKDRAYSQIKSVLDDKDFEIKNQNPLHAVSKKKPENFAIIVLEPSGQNLFYYYESNDKNKKLNKNILKAFKKNDIEYEQSQNAMHLANFSDIVYRYNTGTKKVYSFEEPKTQTTAAQSQASATEKPSTALKGYAGKIDKGVKLNIYLQNAVVKAHPAQLGSRNGSVDIVFNKIFTPNGKAIDISTETVEFDVTNEGRAKQVLTSTVLMAAFGAAIGMLFVAFTGDSSDLLKGALIGAGVSGGGTLITGVAQKGVDAEIPAYTDIEITLDKAVDVVLSY